MYQSVNRKPIEMVESIKTSLKRWTQEPAWRKVQTLGKFALSKGNQRLPVHGWGQEEG